jgi:hypothetical protein
MRQCRRTKRVAILMARLWRRLVRLRHRLVRLWYRLPSAAKVAVLVAGVSARRALADAS